MSDVNVHIKGLETLLKQMESLQERTPELMKQCCGRLAMRAVGIAKKGTPVLDGDLRKAWTATEPVFADGVARCEMVNPLRYASWVEDGHRQEKRFVPGGWEGDRFRYEPGAKDGMMLHPKWIPGFHMGRRALANVQANAQTYLDNDVRVVMNSIAKAGAE